MKKNKRNTARRFFVTLMIMVWMVVAAVPAFAAPKVRKAEYEGKGRVEVDFNSKVRYKNVKVTVKDNKGAGYSTKINEKDDDDLTPATKENMTLEDLEKTWMARTGENQHYLECLFISAKQKDNIDALRDILYKRVRELHVQKYPYNDFLYQDYE